MSAVTTLLDEQRRRFVHARTSVVADSIPGGGKARRCHDSLPRDRNGPPNTTFTADADGQPVLARHADAERGRKSGVKRDEIGAQGLPPVGVERRRPATWSGRSRSRTSPTPPRRSARGSTTPRARTSARRRCAEQVADAVGVAPFKRRRRRRGRRRRHVALHHLEHLEQVAIRQPRGDRHAARPCGPRAPALARRLLGTARKHHAAGRDDGVEAAVVEGQPLGIAQLVVDGAGRRPLRWRAPRRADRSRCRRRSTVAPRRATSREVQPVPVARSRMRSPGRGSSRRTACSIESAIPLLIAS